MDLFEKAKNLGILTEFIDGQGVSHVTDETALKIIVDAFPARTPSRFLEGALVIRSGQPARSELAEAAKLPLRWKIDSESDSGSNSDLGSGLDVVREGETDGRTILWPADLPVGTYRLQLTDAAGTTEDVPFIVAPPRAFTGDFDRGWLLAVQLYSIRSARNWGLFAEQPAVSQWALY
jgi:4-alpha-glucanotransferase